MTQYEQIIYTHRPALVVKNAGDIGISIKSSGYTHSFTYINDSWFKIILVSWAYAMVIY